MSKECLHPDIRNFVIYSELMLDGILRLHEASDVGELNGYRAAVDKLRQKVRRCELPDEGGS